MVLLGVPRKKSPVTPPGIDPSTVRLVAQCLNHYAAPDPTTEDVGLYSQDSESEPVADFCEYRNERHSFALGRQFPVNLRHYYLLNP